MVLGRIQQIRCRSDLAISSKPYQDYKVSYCFAYSDTPTRFLQHAVAPPRLFPRLPVSASSSNFAIAYSLPYLYGPRCSASRLSSCRTECPGTKIDLWPSPGSPSPRHVPSPIPVNVNSHANSIGRKQPRRFAKPPYGPAIRAIHECSIRPSPLPTRCSSHESVIEPGRSWPFSKLPPYRTRTAYCAITTSSTVFLPAETLSKPSDADTR